MVLTATVPTGTVLNVMVQIATAQIVMVQIAAIQNAAIRSVTDDCRCPDAQVGTVARSFAVVRYVASRPVAAVVHCVAVEAHYAVGLRREEAVHFVAAGVDK